VEGLKGLLTSTQKRASGKELELVKDRGRELRKTARNKGMDGKRSASFGSPINSILLEYENGKEWARKEEG